jgi:nucleolin
VFEFTSHFFHFQVSAKAPPAKRRKVGQGVKAETPKADSTEDSSEGENEEIAKPEVGKKRKFSEITKSSSGPNLSNGNGVKPKPKNAPFRRVVSEEIEIPYEALRDNSYKSFDTWGAKASQDLIVTKGKGFRSEKTKKKRGSYRGGSINVGVNSIRFGNDSD